MQSVTTESVYAKVCELCKQRGIALPPAAIEEGVKSVIGAILRAEDEYISRARTEERWREREMGQEITALLGRTETTVAELQECRRIAIESKRNQYVNSLITRHRDRFPEEPNPEKTYLFGFNEARNRKAFEKWEAQSKAVAETLLKEYPLTTDSETAPLDRTIKNRLDASETIIKGLRSAHDRSLVPDIDGIETLIAPAIVSYLGFVQPYLEAKSDEMIALIDIIEQHPGDLLRKFFYTFKVEKRFDAMQRILIKNENNLSQNISPDWYKDQSSLTPAQMIEVALRGTVLRSLFQIEVCVPEPTAPEIEESLWYSHALLLARTRLGKTNVIRWRVQQLLPQIAQGRASVVLMEPKGVLTKEILHLADAWNMRDRLVILDPTDTRASVNIFSKGDGSDVATQETIARVLRVLNTVTTTLTPFQQDALTFCLRAMFYVDAPGSMRLLTAILRRGLEGLPIGELPYRLEEYFANDFKPGDSQAQQIITRLNGLLANPTFEALFDADHSTVDMFEEIQAGKLIIINASAGDDLYARFWIEQVSSCVTPRFKIPYDKRTPTTFIIDEAQTWIKEDLHFAGLLDKAAEARIGMLIAAHHMGQITDVQVRGSIYTNTTLKFAANTTEDILALCRSMGRTTHDFVQTLPKYQFAYYGPDMTEAIRVKFPLVEFDTMPCMTEQQYQELRAANRQKYSYVRAPRPQASAQTALPPQEVSPQALRNPPEPSSPSPPGPETSSKDTW